MTDLRPYDVLQINRRGGAPGGAWWDFSTLRTARDFDDALRILRCGFEDAPGATFRIVRDCGRVIVAESE